MSEHWLIVETSGRTGRVGLGRDGEVVRATDLDPARRHARDLAAAVGATLDADGLRPTDLTGVMVSHGPGGYTGLRVGLISAKALAYATGCQLTPVPTFAAVALQAPPEAREIWVVADALQGHVYLQRYRRADSGTPIPDDALRIVQADEVLVQAGADVWFTGPGVAVYADRSLPPTCHLVDAADRQPTVESLYRAGRAISPVSSLELLTLEPLYLRGSSAEEKAKRDGPRA